MDPVTLGILGTGLLFLLLLIGMPIAFALMLVGFLGVSCLTSVTAALPMIARTVYETSSQYAYTIIPLSSSWRLCGDLGSQPRPLQ